MIIGTKSRTEDNWHKIKNGKNGKRSTFFLVGGCPIIITPSEFTSEKWTLYTASVTHLNIMS
jgi:hypothetical protein